MLDIINNWDKSIEVPSTYRGQPKTWDKSAYNSMVNANKVFVDLLDNTNAKYIMISYYDNGIISIKEMDELLNKYGEVEKIPLVHKTYNKLKGIGKYKAEKELEDTKEYLWVVKRSKMR